MFDKIYHQDSAKEKRKEKPKIKVNDIEEQIEISMATDLTDLLSTGQG